MLSFTDSSNISMKPSLIILLFSTLLFSCKNDEEPLYDVVYRVRGTARTTKITFTDKEGKAVTKDEVLEDWEHGFFTKKDAPLSLSAQNLDSTGSVVATITINGKVYRTATETSAYGTAKVEGKVE